MASSKSSQTAPGVAVYKLHTQLRVPAKADLEKPIYLNEGDQVGADQLEGLQVDALVAGGFLEKVSDPQVACELCQEQEGATKKDKAARYSSAEELAAHYREAHAAFEPPQEV